MRPAANLTETPGRRAVTITPDRILYSDGTTTLWRPSGPVTFRSTRRLTSDRHGARWIVYATGWGRVTLRRADVYCRTCGPLHHMDYPATRWERTYGTVRETGQRDHDSDPARHSLARREAAAMRSRAFAIEEHAEALARLWSERPR